MCIKYKVLTCLKNHKNDGSPQRRWCLIKIDTIFDASYKGKNEKFTALGADCGYIVDASGIALGIALPVHNLIKLTDGLPWNWSRSQDDPLILLSL